MSRYPTGSTRRTRGPRATENFRRRSFVRGWSGSTTGRSSRFIAWKISWIVSESSTFSAR